MESDKNRGKPIYVTSPLLPDLDKLLQGMENIYESGILTNNGPYHQKFEATLNQFFETESLAVFNNGTIALLGAMSIFNFPPGAEVITTPFTFAATAHAISLLGFKPVFADIDEKTMTLDPVAVENAITGQTVAIAAVHVYGNPCNVEALKAIAEKHDLKIIYDAAHSFGTRIDGQPISNWGDATVFSFHATKLFNSFEGGAVVLSDSRKYQTLLDFRNFGIRGEDYVGEVGLNGKMSEIHALAGLLNLEKFEAERNRRKDIQKMYNEGFANCSEIQLNEKPDNLFHSYQYYPVRIKGKRDFVNDYLRENDVIPRKYFSPLCTEFECYQGMGNEQTLPVSYQMAREILCLPFYGKLSDEDVQRIIGLVLSAIESAK